MKKNPIRYTTVDEYIRSAPKEIQPRLRALRTVIRTIAPDATEGISYNIPAYKLEGVLVYFACFGGHIGLYPYTPSMKLSKAELLKYRSGKGTLMFLHETPLPLAFITRIITRRAKEQRGKRKQKR